MVETQEHVSPDRQLTLLVERYSDGDISIGFRGFQWHTHADILASTMSIPVVEAVRIFIGDILEDRSVIAIVYIDGAVHDVWITDDAQKELQYQQPNEEIRFRYWSGENVSICLDGSGRSL